MNRTVSIRRALALVVLTCLAPSALAQVHYHPNGQPWKQRARSGPDAAVGGWYYNLGLTGLRVELTEDAPTELLVRHVLEGTPGDGRVEPGDRIVGVHGRKLETPHRNGYGMDVFGPEGPLLDFARALEASQTKSRRGRLKLTLIRDGKRRTVELNIGFEYGAFGKEFPSASKKTKLVLDELHEYIEGHQRDDGSWGNPVHNTFAPLALLASGEAKYHKAVKKSVKWHARTTSAEDEGSLINWRYMSAAIVMSEYYLATKERWVLEELEEVRDFLMSTQYVSLAQLSPNVINSHPHAMPKTDEDAHGGWGHNPGFEGYGPICMLTGQGALALAMMEHCGLEIDRERHQAAYDFLERGSGQEGYVWYADESANARDWADMGRTGATAVANRLSPYRGGEFQANAKRHAKVIGLHPESFPDTHGSPLMGMAYTALGAAGIDGSYRNLMQANRWWFTLAQCNDGSYYYQPNRDNAGYGADSRLAASAVTAFILSIPAKSLLLTGKKSK
ncbi:MAG: hypothetical protein ACI8QC_004074 [Planctomycetota bacterium]|jgi:hypothetical protein